MIAIGSLLLVVAISLLVTRVATVMLTATGLSREVARFQSRSAFTGAGFTTTESETVVNHPVRRRIVMGLMLLGNAGLVAGVSSLMIGFTRGDREHAGIKLAELVAGLLALVWISRSRRVDRWLTHVIRRLLSRYTDVPRRDHADLLQLAGDYSVAELRVEEGDWTAGRTLAELALRDEGIAVLGLTHAGVYHGTPNGESCVEPGDTLVLYGRGGDLEELDRRPAGPAGDRAHAESVEQAQGR
jgi:hypothetical protein